MILEFVCLEFARGCVHVLFVSESNVGTFDARLYERKVRLPNSMQKIGDLDTQNERQPSPPCLSAIPTSSITNLTKGSSVRPKLIDADARNTYSYW
jgi:hypothetical protein